MVRYAQQFSTSPLSSQSPTQSLATTHICLKAATGSLLLQLATSTAAASLWRQRQTAISYFQPISSICRPEGGNISLGSTGTIRIPRVGDVLNHLFMVYERPAIKACPISGASCVPPVQFPSALDPSNPCSAAESAYFGSLEGGEEAWMRDVYGGSGPFDATAGDASGPAEPYCYWVNAFGQFAARSITMLLSKVPVDKVYSDFAFMWEEVAGKPGKRLGEMIGKYYCVEELIAASTRKCYVYSPVPFYFELAPGNSLPLVAVQLGGFELSVEMEALHRLVVQSGEGLRIINEDTGTDLTANDVKVLVDANQILFEQAERDKFQASQFEQLITNTVRCHPVSVSAGQTSAVVDMKHGQVVTEVLFGVRRECMANNNQWTNLSGVNGFDPILFAQVDVNNSARQQQREATYFRLIQPYMHHTCTPDAFVYNWAPAEAPEEMQFTGGLSTAAFDDFSLRLWLQPGLGEATIFTFLRCLNLLKFQDQSAVLTMAVGLN